MTAQLELARTLLAPLPARPDDAELAQAAAASEGLNGAVRGREAHRISASLLSQAAALIERGMMTPAVGEAGLVAPAAPPPRLGATTGRGSHAARLRGALAR